MTGFFGKQRRRQGVDALRRRDMADRLGCALMRAGRIDSVDVNRWQWPFGALERSHSIAEIDRVLEWFERNCQEAFCPEVHTATGFAQKFVQIRDAMGRSTVDALLAQDPGPLARKICRELGLTWPGELDRDQERFAEACLGLHRAFMAQVAKLRSGKFSGLAEHLDASVGCGELFVGAWMEQAHRAAWRSPDGFRFGRWMPVLSNERFARLVSRACSEYLGEGADWKTVFGRKVTP